MMVNKTLRFLLFALIVIISWIDFQYMYNQPIWGDVDEIAHFDYIEKISNGNLKYDNDIFIEKEVLESNKELDFIPVMELDLNARIQYIDYTYWSPGTYYLRIVNGTKTKQVAFLTRP